MCLAIPAQVSELIDDENRSALVDVLGVTRQVNIELLVDDPPVVGDWVLIHVGCALNKIGVEQAEEQLTILAMLGEASAAFDEVEGLLEAENRKEGES